MPIGDQMIFLTCTEWQQHWLTKMIFYSKDSYIKSYTTHRAMPLAHKPRNTHSVFSLPWLHLHRGDNVLLLVVILVKRQVTVHWFVSCTVQVAVCEHSSLIIGTFHMFKLLCILYIYLDQPIGCY